MIDNSGGVFKRRGNVVFFKIRIIAQNVCACRAASEQIENVAYADALAADAGPLSAYLRIKSDAIEMTLHRNGAFGCTTSLVSV